MKLMICTMVFGSRSRSSPRTISCGSVVAARVRPAITPRVALASMVQAATRPGR